jgi:hypothetical protein
MKPPRQAWTAEDVATLVRLYPDVPTSEIAAQLGRPVQRVYAKAGNLGLRKSDAFLASDKSGRMLKGGRLSVGTQFQPGVPSWSKGTKGVCGVQPGCRATQFKPGQRSGVAARRWVPIGSYRINGDGYLDRKVTDLGRGPRDWIAVHRLVWMEANGPVPDGYVVCFKRGRFTTKLEEITLDAVELVSRADLMKRNTIHNYPKPIAQLVQLRGALNRKINRLERERREEQDR